MRRHADLQGVGSEGSGDEEHGHSGSGVHGGVHGVVKRDASHALRQRTPSPDVGDDTMGWRRTSDASGEELLRSRVRLPLRAHCAKRARPERGVAAAAHCCAPNLRA